MHLKQSTAVVISFGPFLDKTDGVALETGLVSALDHASTGIMLAKNGGTLAVRHATVTASEYDAHGCYKVTLDTTDTATIGKLRVIYTDATTCLPVWRDFEVVAANVFDSIYGAATTKLQVDVNQISTDATAADNLEAACDGTTYNIGGGAVVAASVTGAAGSVTGSVGSVTGAVGSVTGAVGSVTGNVGGNVTGSVGSIAANGLSATSIATGAITNAKFAASAIDATAIASNAIAAAKIATGAITNAKFAAGAIDAAAIAADAIGASELATDAVTEITAGVWNAVRATYAAAGSFGQGAASVQGNVTGSVASVTGAVGSVTGAVGSVTGAVGSVTGNVGGNVTGSVGSVTGAVGSVTGNVGGNVTGTVGGLATQAKADVNAECDTAISDAGLTAAGISDAVWDELLSGHAGVGSTGAALSAAGGSGDPWSTALPGAYGAGTAGKIIGDNLNAPVATVDTVVDGIATQIGSAGAGLTAVPWNASWDAEVQSEATDALNAYDPPTKTEMDTGHSSLATATNLATVDTVVDGIATQVGTAGAGLTAVPWNASWDAEVQSEVDDALGAAITEPANLSATKSVKSFLWYLYSRFFHKNTQTATQQLTYKADGTTALATRTVSDDATTQTLGAGS